MHRKEFIIFLCALIIALQIKCDPPPGMELMVNWTGEYFSTVDLGKLYEGDNITIKILVPGINKMTGLELHQGTYLSPINGFVILYASSDIIYNYTITKNESYYIVNKLSYINRFLFQVRVNNIVREGNPVSQYSYSFQVNNIVRLISFLSPCTIYLDKTLIQNQLKNKIFQFLSPQNQVQLIIDGVWSQYIIAGQYQLSIYNSPLPIKPFNYSIPIYHKTSNKCQYQEIYYCQGPPNQRCRIRNGQTCSLDGNAICISECGNGILDTGEECDKTDHCTSQCKPETGFTCFPNNTCIAISNCGDGKLDAGEDCDSVPHCTSSCKVETGYTCSNNICYSCGNNILQVGQECDNGNKPGCSQCKVVPPYKCKSTLSTSSLCYLCGNSIYEFGEECDNGNKSGCINCTIDRGYKCKSKINSISNCAGVCGDLILTADEQCDNGNMSGCINCVKDPKYTCTVLPLKPSVCYYCGNYILQVGEQCDNSNKKGCIDCKIQPGYNCRIDPRYCFQIKKICGNGERQIEEQCDDGNKGNGDGCNGQCKIETGYICSLRLGEKSSCQILASLKK